MVIVFLSAGLATLTGVASPDPRFSWPDATPPHEEISCQTCHGLVAQAGTEATAIEDRGKACRGCHDLETGDPDAVNLFHLDATDRCVRCHSFHEPETFTAMGRRHPMGAGENEAWGHCQTCHTAAGSATGVSDGHRVAADLLYHSRTRKLENLSLSQGCMICHSSDNIGGPRLPRGMVTPRFNGHASHRYGITLVVGRQIGTGRIRSEIDPRVPLFEGRIECQTCHDITQPTTDHLIPFDPPYAMCETCHDLHPRSSDRKQEDGDVAALTPDAAP